MIGAAPRSAIAKISQTDTLNCLAEYLKPTDLLHLSGTSRSMHNALADDVWRRQLMLRQPRVFNHIKRYNPAIADTSPTWKKVFNYIHRPLHRIGAVYNHSPALGHTQRISSMHPLPDGRFVTGSWDGTVIVWNDDGTLQQQLFGHSDWVTCVSSLADGRIVAGARNGVAIIWQSDGTIAAQLGRAGDPFPQDGGMGYIYSINGLSDHHVLTASKDNILRVWDVEKTARMADGVDKVHDCATQHLDSISQICRTADGTQFISASFDHSAVIWNADGTPHMRLGETRNRNPALGHINWLATVHGLPDGHIVTGSYDRMAIIWNSDGTIHQRLGCVLNSDPAKGHTAPVMAITHLADGRVVTGSIDHTAIIWNTDGSICRHLGVERNENSALGHTGPVLSVCVLADGRIATASDDRTVILWAIDN